MGNGNVVPLRAARSRPWRVSPAFLLSIAVTWLCPLHIMGTSSISNPSERPLGVPRVPQQTVGRPVDRAVVDGGQPIDRVEVLDVAIVDADWGAKDVAFTIRNRALQAITAWYVEFEVLHSDGFTARTAVSKDGYAEFEGLRQGAEPRIVVPPSGELRTRLRLGPSPGHPAPVSAPKATVLGAIFGDLTAAGQPFALNQMFGRRQQFSDGWAAVVAALDSAEAGPTGRATIATALSALEVAERQRFPKSTATLDPYASARLTIMNARALLRAESAKGTTVAPEDSVHNVLLRARGELAAIQRHRRPRS